MISKLSRIQRPFYIGIVTIFLISIFVGIGGYYFIGADKSDTVAVVGGTKIPTVRYEARVDQYMDALRQSNKDQEIPDDVVKQVRQGMLRDMVVEELLAQQAEKMGIEVSDLEVAYNIRNTPRFQRDGQFDQGLYFQTVRYGLRSTPEEYEREQRRAMLSAKFKNIIFSAVKLTPQDLEEQYQAQDKKSKTYEKDKEKFAQSLQQNRALDAINFYLKQIASQVQIEFPAQQQGQQQGA